MTQIQLIDVEIHATFDEQKVRIIESMGVILHMFDGSIQDRSERYAIEPDVTYFATVLAWVISALGLTIRVYENYRASALPPALEALLLSHAL